MKKISVITLHFNQKDLTDQFLLSLSQIDQGTLKLQAVVVDNGSKKEFKLTKKFPNLEIVVLRSDKNLGFSAGNNFGIKHSLKSFNPDYFLFINNDTLHSKNFLTSLVDFASTAKDLGIVCPKIYFAKNYEYHKQSYSLSQLGKVIWYAGGSIDWQNFSAFHRAVDELDRGQTEFDPKFRDQVSMPYYNYSQSDFATGCCMLVPKKIIEQTQGFDEKFFLYFEDTDLSLRIKKLNKRIYYYPESSIYHLNAGSSAVGSSFQIAQMKKSRLRFVLKHASMLDKVKYVLKSAYL